MFNEYGYCVYGIRKVENEYYYFDVSAKNGNNISLAFEKMIKLILENKEIKERIMGNNNKNEVKKIDLNHNDKIMEKEKQKVYN